jgi:TatD DNase family protein
MLIDTHCHLDLDKFDADRADVILRAQLAGVARILIPATNLTSSLSAVKLAESHPMLFAAVGVHPMEAAIFRADTLSNLHELASSSPSPLGGVARGGVKIVAIGEIGLDYYWDAAPHDLQQRVLRDQLDLAAELSLPVIIHFREKGDASYGPCAVDLMVILEDWISRLRREKNPLAERPGVLHSFSGSKETAWQALALNFYIGVTGPVTYRKERQGLIASLPLDRLLMETDSPFLAPAPHRGKRNEPAFVRLIADKIAEIHHCNVEEVATATTAGAGRIFGWEETF